MDRKRHDRARRHACAGCGALSARRGGELERGPEAFVDGLAALVAEEKERLKRDLSEATSSPSATGGELGAKIDALAFELAELRGRIESLQASVDAIAARGRG